MLSLWREIVEVLICALPTNKFVLHFCCTPSKSAPERRLSSDSGTLL